MSMNRFYRPTDDDYIDDLADYLRSLTEDGFCRDCKSERDDLDSNGRCPICSTYDAEISHRATFFYGPTVAENEDDALEIEDDEC